MHKTAYIFKKDSNKIAFDLKHRSTIKFNISKYNTSFEAGLKRYDNLEMAKKCAATIKRDVLRNLPKYLEEFEKAALGNGIEIIWCENSGQAVNYIKKIIYESGISKVIKTKSMITEEIDLNHELQKIGVEAIETDLGEFIVQKAGEKPYHILTPAMHKSRQDVANLFNKLYKTPLDQSAEGLTKFVRKKLRYEFDDAKIGISGANFLLAKEGAIAITENEGNGIFTVSSTKIHIVIAGIEKILPSVNNLNLFWPLLACHGTGQQLSVYNSVIFGPRRGDEKNGPERMVVVLLDNGRSNLYKKKYQSEALACIRCGACLNGCPIYRNVGGYTYNSVYTGPIGSVITPHLKSFKKYNHLSYASSLCGRCYEVCPVKINLPQLLLYNRKEAVENNLKSFTEEKAFKIFAWANDNPKRFQKLFSLLKVGLLIIGLRKKYIKPASIPFKTSWKNSLGKS